MSVEASVITLLVEEGSPKKAFQQGISSEDFELYDDEFRWIERRATDRRPINPRIFRERFPDFEWIVPNENVIDLLSELKQERAFTKLSAAIETVVSDLEIENAVEKAGELREYVTEILKAHSPVHDIDLGAGWKERMRTIKALRVLRENGEVAGIPSGFQWIDHMWGGFLPGRVVTLLGRTGEGKSLTLAKFACSAWTAGYRIGFFSPEMNRHEHECRMHTLLSADSLIQERTGIKKSFRNRALMEGVGFPLKKYENFIKYLDTLRGRCILFTQQYRRTKMTLAYIDSKIEDLKLDMVIIDPIYKLRGPFKRENKVWELADLIDGIEDMAKGHNIPIIVTNQAHRQQGMSARRRAPHKDTSYMSDAITHESDHVIGVRYDAEDHLLQMRCSKSRFGGEFDITARCYPNIGLIEETSKPEGSWRNGDRDTKQPEPGADLPAMQEAGDTADES